MKCVVHFQMAYNADVDILLPFVHHKGNLSDDVQRYYRECFAFVKTEDGHPNYDSLYECVHYIER